MRFGTCGSGLVKSVGVIRRTPTVGVIAQNLTASISRRRFADGCKMDSTTCGDLCSKVKFGSNTHPDATILTKKVGEEECTTNLFPAKTKPTWIPSAQAPNALRRLDAHFGRATTSFGLEMLAVVQPGLQTPSEMRSSFININQEFYNEHEKLEWRTDVGVRTVKRRSGWWLIVDIYSRNDGFFLSLPPDVVYNTEAQEYRYNRKDYFQLSKAVIGQLTSVTSFMDRVIGNNCAVHAYYSAIGCRLDVKYVDVHRKIVVRFHSYPGYPDEIFDDDE